VEVWYVDTSAVVKLVEPEHETPALRDWLRSRRWVVSDLHRTELRRAALRVGPGTLARADRLLTELDVLTLSRAEYDRAGRLEPTRVRSLDALHLAVAQALGRDLAGIVGYDQRLLRAAAEAGISIASPM
jgi:hypothetical protein